MKNIRELTVDSIRVLAVDAIEKANSGHPGICLGAAPMAYTLLSTMKHNPKDLAWDNRDRFVLSAGHGSALLYSLYHHFGYGISMEDMKQFRQEDSLTPGHPEYRHTPGVETTTGPLGQGIANAVGMAMAEAHLAAHFNRPGYNVVDHYTFALAGDGCMMEGISGEASSLAGTLKLGKLIVLYDDNDISIEGNTDIAFRENVGLRYEAYGWQVIRVEDGNDLDAIKAAIEAAKAKKDQPSLIIVKTKIGYGCLAKEGSAASHGAPLGPDNVRATKEFFGFDPDASFCVPESVYAHTKSFLKAAEEEEKGWQVMFYAYCAAYPKLAEEWVAFKNTKIDESVLDDEAFMTFKPSDATRNSSGVLLNRLAEKMPNLIGGSADLSPSNMTTIKSAADFSAENYAGRNLHFGVREHAMAAIVNGMYLHGGLRPYAATFFVFSDYMKHSMRLSALMKLPVVYILTHDSIGVGEDGPTHEPVEQLAMLRSIPGFTVYRPADAREAAAAWVYAINANGPTALVLTRQALPTMAETGKKALKGGYVLKEGFKEVPDIILMATGSEVELIYNAAEQLAAEGISARVVSIPSFEVFNAQSAEYKEEVLPSACRNRLAVEAASAFGWHQYIGLDGETITMEGYGASAPAKTLFKKFGFTVENVVNKAKMLVERK